MAFNFFKSLYEADPRVCPNKLMDLVGIMISEEMNTRLCREFTDEEISNALFQMGLLKAPGPDGFPTRFFQRQWEILKEDIIQAVKNSLMMVLCHRV